MTDVLYAYENIIMRLITIFKKGGIRKRNRRGGFDQTKLHTCMKTSQWNPFVQLIYANKMHEMEVELKTALKQSSL
jgi:hypothetical protein